MWFESKNSVVDRRPRRYDTVVPVLNPPVAPGDSKSDLARRLDGTKLKFMSLSTAPSLLSDHAYQKVRPKRYPRLIGCLRISAHAHLH